MNADSFFARLNQQMDAIRSPDYSILGLSPGANQQDVGQAFRRLALIHHPDHGGRDEDFLKLLNAYRRITQGSIDQPG